MSTTPPPAGGAQPMSEAQLQALIEKAVSGALPGAVDAALAPFAKAQTDVFGRLAAALPGQKESAEFDQKRLGKYPYGRKARAIALAVLEHGSMELDAIERAVKSHWRPTIADETIAWAKDVKDLRAKGLTVGNASAAGDMVFPSYDLEWIELLRNNAIVRGLCRTVPMPRGATSRRKQTGAATASYQGELGPITTTQQSVGRVNLSYKKLTAATVVSNDLIRFAGGGEADRFVQEDLLKQTTLREDRAFLVGNPPIDTGSPQGIRYQTAAANIAGSAGTSLANFQSDLTNLIALVQKNNIPVSPNDCGFIMSPSTFWVIYALTTTTGDWVFAPMLAEGRPRILGMPVYLTTQLEVTNSWIGASSGLIGFIHWPAMEIHDSMSRTVEAFRGGAYYDGTVVQSGISNDETVITCISEHDFLQTYDVAASFKTGYAT